MDVREKAKLLPENPGVYIMKDRQGNIIYVGKAKSLKKRVGQYFQASRNHAPKIVRMIEGINDFDYILTDTEFEALLLECSMIKEIKPMYNSQMKNDKRYCYIKVALMDEFPFIDIKKEKADDGSMYFGPYTSQSSVERAVNVIIENFNIRHCSTFQRTLSGCLNYQLGNCMGPCRKDIDRKEYNKSIQCVIELLEGKDKSLLKRLNEKMEEASLRLDFDKAVKYRDDMYALNHLVNKQLAIGFAQRNRNIAVMELIDESTAKLILIKGIRIIYKCSLDLKERSMAHSGKYVSNMILEHFSESTDSRRTWINKQDVDPAQIIHSYLKNKKGCSHIIVPAAWLNEKNREKLNKGVDKLISRIDQVKEQSLY